MISLEKQCVSLELAKRLKELGVKQESLFHWQPWMYGGDKMVIVEEGAEDWSDEGESYSAFTVAELGEMLRHRVGDLLGYDVNGFQFRPDARGHTVYWWNYVKGDFNHFERADTEADARAKMLIYLVENGFITL
jgi:hypothetical protein